MFAVLYTSTKQAIALRRQARNVAGFTIVELIVVVAVLGVVIGLLFGPLNDLYTSNEKGLRTSIATADNRNALQTVRQTVVASQSFNSTNNRVSDPMGTTWTGGANVLVTSNYATWTNSGNRSLLKGGADCEPLMNHYIFFVQGKTLFRKTLTLKGVQPACDGASWDQKQTCTAGTLASFTRCEATDAKLLTNVEQFKVDYYESSSSNDTAIPSAAKAVLVTITVKNSPTATAVTSKMRISRTNGS